MPENHTSEVEPATVECAVCKKLIPPSEVISPEAHEYVLYFCGGQCHAEWEREQAEKLEREFEQRSGVKRDRELRAHMDIVVLHPACARVVVRNSDR